MTEKTTSEKKKTKMLLDVEEDRPAPGNKEFRQLVGRSPGKPGKIKTAHARGRGLRREKN